MLSAWRLERALRDGVVSPPVFAPLTLNCGTKVWQAVCRPLNDDHQDPKRFFLYSGSGGSGTDISKVVAARKAICEVLERLTYFSTRSDPDQRAKYCFNQDDSTNGMAAFPELFCNTVRKKAFCESVERWAIKAWWLGLLRSESLELGKGVSGLRIETPHKVFVVVLWGGDDLRAYGFAADIDLERAVFRAQVELSRNAIVLKNWNGQPLPADAPLIERRLVFFSQSAGKALFDKRVDFGSKSRSVARFPAIAFNGEIRGEYSKYVKIWRTVFKEDKHWQDSKSLDYFHF